MRCYKAAKAVYVHFSCKTGINPSAPTRRRTGSGVDQLLQPLALIMILLPGNQLLTHPR